MITDAIKEQFLLDLVELCYPHGDDYFAHRSKRNIWHFGYVNDNELAHGKGINNQIYDSILTKMIENNH